MSREEERESTGLKCTGTVVNSLLEATSHDEEGDDDGGGEDDERHNEADRPDRQRPTLRGRDTVETTQTDAKWGTETR